MTLSPAAAHQTPSPLALARRNILNVRSTARAARAGGAAALVRVRSSVGSPSSIDLERAHCVVARKGSESAVPNYLVNLDPKHAAPPLSGGVHWSRAFCPNARTANPMNAPDGKPAFVANTEEFIDNLRNVHLGARETLTQLLRELDGRAFIAGGAVNICVLAGTAACTDLGPYKHSVASIATRQPPHCFGSDVDVFFGFPGCTQVDVNDMASRFIDTVPEETISALFRTTSSLTLVRHGYANVQLVLTPFSGPEEVVRSFDMDNVKAWFDGNSVRMLGSGILSHMTRTVHLRARPGNVKTDCRCGSTSERAVACSLTHQRMFTQAANQECPPRIPIRRARQR